MNSITVLAAGIHDLWIGLYGVMAGWGVTVCLIIAVLATVMIRLLRVEARVRHMENQLVATERDFNLEIKKWNNK